MELLGDLYATGLIKVTQTGKGAGQETAYTLTVLGRRLLNALKRYDTTPTHPEPVRHGRNTPTHIRTQTGNGGVRSVRVTESQSQSPTPNRKSQRRTPMRWRTSNSKSRYSTRKTRKFNIPYNEITPGYGNTN